MRTSRTLGSAFDFLTPSTLSRIPLGGTGVPLTDMARKPVDISVHVSSVLPAWRLGIPAKRRRCRNAVGTKGGEVSISGQLSHFIYVRGFAWTKSRWPGYGGAGRPAGRLLPSAKSQSCWGSMAVRNPAEPLQSNSHPSHE